MNVEDILRQMQQDLRAIRDLLESTRPVSCNKDCTTCKWNCGSNATQEQHREAGNPCRHCNSSFDRWSPS